MDSHPPLYATVQTDAEWALLQPLLPATAGCSSGGDGRQAQAFVPIFPEDCEERLEVGRRRGTSWGQYNA